MKARRNSKPIQKREANVESDCFRAATFTVRADTLNDEQRSVQITLATETPVPVFDWERMEIVNEVLLMEGLEIPRQLPMLNSHSRYDAQSVIGSIRELSKAGGELQGRAFFASGETSRKVYELVREGHLTDFSIGFRALETKFVRRGDKEKINGREFTGPVRVVTRAVAKEGSAVAIGADPNAKVRGQIRAYVDPFSLREEVMLTKLHELCVKRGMPTETEGAAVFDWLDSHLAGQRSESPELVELRDLLKEHKPTKPANKETNTPTIEDERKRVSEIVDLCDANGVDSKHRKEWVDGGLTPDQVARKILDMRQDGATGKPLGMGRIEHVESEREKICRAASAAITLRAIQGAGVNPEAALERARGIQHYGDHKIASGHVDIDAVQRCEALVELVRKPPEGYREFRHAGLLDIARAFVEMSGQRTSFWTRQQIAREAIRLSSIRSDAAYNTTGSFANVMLDATNKTLLAAYDEATVTYPMWVRTAPSTPDFKTLNRIRFGELPDPEVIPENHPYPEKQTSDAKESYAVEKYGEMFSISMEAIVNDDLNAISRIPAMQGNAMRRKINKVVYAILTSNPTLSDGVALFHASSHGANLDAAAPTVGAFNTGYTVMGLQTGLSGTGTILNIQPRYVISGLTLSATILQILNSIADPAAGGSAAGNSNTVNIYGPNGPRKLMPVFDGQLDAAAASTPTGWWFAADPSQVDTIELTFLQGEESPALDREEGFNVDAVKYKIRQTFAAKAIDYRGLYQGNAVG